MENRIHVGGDASESALVAGSNNQVKVTHAESAETQQTNTANDDATVYAAQKGDIHIHENKE